MSSLDFLVALERLRSGFTDAVFIGASWLGMEEGYPALLTIVYLCVDHRFGFRLLVMFLASAYYNAQVKAAYDTTRLLLEGRGYEARAPFASQVLKVGVALPVLFGLKTVGGTSLPEVPWATVTTYAAIGLAATYVLPALFTATHGWRLRRADRE